MNNRTVYISVSDKCQLGNWLFMYAAAISHGDAVIFHDKNNSIDPAQFQRALTIFPDAHYTTTIPQAVAIHRQPSFGFSPFPDTPSGDLCIEGTFQSEKYIDRKKVRAHLSIPLKHRNYLQNKYSTWLEKPNVTALHVRRGDYLTVPHILPFVGKRYFRDAINRLQDCQDFIIVTDDYPWCKNFFTKKNFPSLNFLFAENETDIDHLYLQALCKNNIISNSSFSWWGAWLNCHPNKRIIAPATWFGPDGPRDWSDIYLPEMEIISNTQSPLDQLFIKYHSIRERIAQCVSRIVRHHS